MFVLPYIITKTHREIVYTTLIKPECDMSKDCNVDWRWRRSEGMV